MEQASNWQPLLLHNCPPVQHNNTGRLVVRVPDSLPAGSAIVTWRNVDLQLYSESSRFFMMRQQQLQAVQSSGSLHRFFYNQQNQTTWVFVYDQKFFRVNNITLIRDFAATGPDLITVHDSLFCRNAGGRGVQMQLQIRLHRSPARLCASAACKSILHVNSRAAVGQNVTQLLGFVHQSRVALSHCAIDGGAPFLGLTSKQQVQVRSKLPTKRFNIRVHCLLQSGHRMQKSLTILPFTIWHRQNFTFSSTQHQLVRILINRLLDPNWPRIMLPNLPALTIRVLQQQQRMQLQRQWRRTSIVVARGNGTHRNVTDASYHHNLYLNIPVLTNSTRVTLRAEFDRSGVYEDAEIIITIAPFDSSQRRLILLLSVPGGIVLLLLAVALTIAKRGCHDSGIPYFQFVSEV